MQDYFSAQEKKINNNFKSKLFTAKNVDTLFTLEPTPQLAAFRKPTKEQTMKSTSKLYGDFWNTIVKDESNINIEMFNEYFQFHNPSFY